MGRNGNIRRGDVFWVNAKEIEIFSPWAPEGSQFRDKDGHPSNSSVMSISAAYPWRIPTVRRATGFSTTSTLF